MNLTSHKYILSSESEPIIFLFILDILGPTSTVYLLYLFQDQQLLPDKILFSSRIELTKIPSKYYASTSLLFIYLFQAQHLFSNSTAKYWRLTASYNTTSPDLYAVTNSVFAAVLVF